MRIETSMEEKCTNERKPLHNNDQQGGGGLPGAPSLWNGEGPKVVRLTEAISVTRIRLFSL